MKGLVQSCIVSSIIFLFGGTVQAQPVVIQKVSKKSPVFVASGYSALSLIEGDIIPVSHTCRLKVQKVKGRIAKFDYRNCKESDKIKPRARFNISKAYNPETRRAQRAVIAQLDSRTTKISSNSIEGALVTEKEHPRQIFEGFRVGVGANALSFRTSYRNDLTGEDVATDLQAKNAVSIYVGYGRTSIRTFGYIGKLVLSSFQIETGDEVSNYGRVALEANATYGFTDKISLFAGGAGSYFLDKTTADRWGLGGGLQGGLGYQITNLIGIDLEGNWLVHRTEDDGSEAFLDGFGGLISIHATF